MGHPIRIYDVLTYFSIVQICIFSYISVKQYKNKHSKYQRFYWVYPVAFKKWIFKFPFFLERFTTSSWNAQKRWKCCTLFHIHNNPTHKSQVTRRFVRRFINLYTSISVTKTETVRYIKQSRKCIRCKNKHWCMSLYPTPTPLKTSHPHPQSQVIYSRFTFTDIRHLAQFEATPSWQENDTN